MGIKAPDEQGCNACASCHALRDAGAGKAGRERSVVELNFDRT